MPNPFMVASMAILGLLSSTFAVAEVSDNIAAQAVTNALLAPAVVADAATPAPVEPAVQISSDQIEADASSSAPRADEADTLAELVQQIDLSDGNETDLNAVGEARCLATAVYYEARSESLAGQLAVANVIVARAKSGRFPRSLCGVVTQPGQFSFVRGGRLPSAPMNAGQWRTAQAISRIALDGSWANPVRGALFFHAARVSPGWDRERVTRIGGHVFYR